ncbi:PepSY domain-containing protein [Altererythrobacter xixiisoli]|uniref:PepSY domain-containing protein n=1 Tax=Croceibacterium xixiisoli TaxID=1476466 RepID=A0A6I4TXK7_9SPHN|nr:PepSY-associated TM helix domain-containing protein [Croceibacterium xixiisoli]MXP00735.1 PepSY domain-containing protein [Croceibacterium xixiisoli]
MGTPIRIALRRIHLWLGLSIGLVFAVLGLSGSALVFYIELDAQLNPAIRQPAGAGIADWQSPVWDRVLATAQTHFPHAGHMGGKWSFEVTGAPGAIPARLYPADDPHNAAGHHGVDPTMLWFSADGTQLLRQDRWGSYAMTWIYDLHRNLLLGELGNQLVGWLGVVMLLLLISGLAVWWPRQSLRRESWRKALAFKRGAAPIRRLRDWHKLSGLWSLPLLLLLTATGVLLALPPVKDSVLGTTVAPVVPVPAVKSVIPAAGTASQIRIARALAAGHGALPDGRLAWIDVPAPGGDGAFRLRVQVPGDPSHRFPYSYVFVDQYSGAVLAVHDVRQGTAASTVNAWLRPLHDASILGTPTRILGVIIGLLPTALFVTGLLHWRRRVRAARTPSAPRPSRALPPLSNGYSA